MTTAPKRPELIADLPHKPHGDASLVDDLGIRELRIANAKLRADCVDAITRPTADRWDALALVGWLWHKRQDPTARLERWTELTAGQIARQLDIDGGDDDDLDGDQVDDVDASLADPPEILEPAGEVAGEGERDPDPTVPAP